MARKTRETLVMVLVTICLALVLADAARWFLRLDLTRNSVYSISPVSRDILLGIPQQVHVTYFLSDTLRSLSPSMGRIVDLLQEYAAESRGRVLLTVIDPDRTGQGESARRYGILPQQIQVVQQNEQRTIEVYSGIAIDYLDRYTSLPAVITPDGLEYSLSFAVRKVLSGRRLVVGVIVGERGKTLKGDYDSLQTGLSRDYALHEFLPGDTIPPEVDVLMVLGGTQWGERQLRPVDAYVRGGGKVLFAAKGLRVQTAGALSAQPVGSSALLDMIGSYGVRIGSEMVLDRACRDYRLPQQKPGGQVAWETIATYPPWVAVQSPDVSSTNPITASFSGLDLLWPVALSAEERTGVHAEPLVKSTASAWLQEPPFVVNPYKVSQEGPPQGDPRRGQFVLAYALSGTFPSRFTAGAWSAPTRIIVVGDDDFLTDLMQFSDSLPNVLFVENAILWLSGNSDLLTIKTRAATEGRLDRIQDPVARGRLMLAAELLNVAVIPLLVLLFGVLRALRRREKGAS
jgi:ABC-type uncharacterized transport system involved in gliding motility auxiliary subunit